MKTLLNISILVTLLISISCDTPEKLFLPSLRNEYLAVKRINTKSGKLENLSTDSLILKFNLNSIIILKKGIIINQLMDLKNVADLTNRKKGIAVFKTSYLMPFKSIKLVRENYDYNQRTKILITSEIFDGDYMAKSDSIQTYWEIIGAF